ncbi:cupin domain-containing protein [Reichenbachiella agarivorans]|uniref:Cupin domain-containing protein n=1 Tax=Reichenbachiella agarivorans TaxID=2979464 RepID=A0ABY6CWU7_9BACT|nr:cupin domain-containing protein [Reichenbachiella agarivorans]UXP33923.1 cupin domain-containing protein [Reichenbachiella agarivorans]
MTDKIQSLITSLDLAPHPEGGYFKETYRSAGLISQTELGQPYEGNRNQSTAIYYLLTADTFSAFHRIKQDEIWHFYQGDPIDLHTIDEAGVHTLIQIGSDIAAGQVPQYVVPGGVWFAAKVSKSGVYSLAGCTVSPGFDFMDFELGKRQELQDKFTLHAELISAFTRI